MHNLQTKYSISLIDGDFFDFKHPERSGFNIRTIAHALAHICRYGGHSTKFYSVAEHSVLVSYCVPDHLRLTALLHDASEAYCGDMPSPLKKLCKSYQTIENNIQEALAKHYGLPYPFPPEIHTADKRVYQTERQTIAGGSDTIWHTEYTAAPVSVVGYSPPQAKKFFLDRYNELTHNDRYAESAAKRAA